MAGRNGRADSPCDDAKPDLAEPITDTPGNSEYFTPIFEPIACSSDIPEAVGWASTSCEHEPGPSSSNLSNNWRSKTPGCMEHIGSSEYASAVSETYIESSKLHWSELTTSDLIEQEQREHIAETNKEIYASLQKEWPFFFRHSDAEWILGEKIAEGGQAEIYAGATIYPNGKRFDNLALKVFKLEDLSLQDLQKQWPLPFLQNGHRIQFCWVVKEGRLLQDGRFAFRMNRYWGDLRMLIDLRMQDNEDPPFTPGKAYGIIFEIAKGMQKLHQFNILHRGLKASNVLIWFSEDMIPQEIFDPRYNDGFICQVADYECNNGVIGTGFWRAPEILWEVKDRSIHNKPELFSQSADVYSFAMTCYEILKGKFPFQHLESRNNFELVYSGKEKLEWPEYIDPLVKELLNNCSHLQPL